MKGIKELKLVFDKEEYFSGDTVTGKLIVRTKNPNLRNEAKVFLKLYDKLTIEWDEHQVHSIHTRVFKNFKKPYQLNIEEVFDKASASDMLFMGVEDHVEVEFFYSFNFQLPEILQGTIKLPFATCEYFLKAYLTDDLNVTLNYQRGVNAFEEFFKSLNQTYCKEEVKISNRLISPSNLRQTVQQYQTQSSNYRIAIIIPKKIFYSNDIIDIHAEIEHANEDDFIETLKLHKISFKLFQCCKLHADKPFPKSHIREQFITQITKRKFDDDYEDNEKRIKIVINQQFLIPPNLLSTTSKRIIEDVDVVERDMLADQHKFNCIRIDYKLGIEFWKNMFNLDSELDIPIMINPEL